MKLDSQPAYTPIGAFEAKTRLSEILRKVEQGERFTVTVRGRAVAEIIPARSADQAARNAAIERLMHLPRATAVDGDTILEWIREGRE